ncbi:MAG: circadian clock protein KaiC [Bacteroidota bacterium]|nr:circadian clock protein KaiC [Bacteroidota bacterium]
MNVKKKPTGIAGFDHLSEGGLPTGRTTLVAGSSGSSKTLFAAQYLAMGILQFNETGVFVTFEEQVPDLRRNLISFGWDIDTWEKEGKWIFVDASPKIEGETITVGDYDLSAFRIRIEHAIKKTNAQRVVIDSIGSVFSQFPESHTIRRELFKIAVALNKVGVTTVITAERVEEYGPVSRYGVEEFIADNVIILRNVLNKEKRRRTIEILKFRGSDHKKGENPFTIVGGEGIVIIPLSAMELKQKSSTVRVSSGIDELDKMCGKGFFRDSIILVSGATGTGKTLLTASFVKGASKAKNKCLLFAFEESREQIFRNAKGWGMDFEKMEKEGALKVVCVYPEISSLEDHLLTIQRLVTEFKPDRIAIDSLSALTRTSSEKGFREFIIALTSFLKHAEITGLFTATTPLLTGGSSVTEGNISTITDSIILLRYVELAGEMQRSITLLKMRGSKHDANIRRYTIDHNGMTIGKPYTEVTGIITGNPVTIKQNS